jgi:hypothetical protein
MPGFFGFLVAGFLPREADMTLEHFQEKWNPVFRPKVRTKKSWSKFMFP